MEACSISGAINYLEWLTKKEGGSVWLVISLKVKKMESLVGETPGRGRLWS